MAETDRRMGAGHSCKRGLNVKGCYRSTAEMVDLARARASMTP